MSHLPKTIFETVSATKNCEDIAMSFFVSALTGNTVPLLADIWATKQRFKLKVKDKISGGSSHKKLRDSCVNDFAEILQLKGTLKPHTIIHTISSLFEQGALIENPTQFSKNSARQIALKKKILNRMVHLKQKHKK